MESENYDNDYYGVSENLNTLVRFLIDRFDCNMSIYSFLKRKIRLLSKKFPVSCFRFLYCYR